MQYPIEWDLNPPNICNECLIPHCLFSTLTTYHYARLTPFTTPFLIHHIKHPDLVIVFTAIHQLLLSPKKKKKNPMELLQLMDARKMILCIPPCYWFCFFLKITNFPHKA